MCLLLAASCGKQSISQKGENTMEESGQFAQRRSEMVQYQIRARDITNKKVIEAMLKVERHRFVPEDVKEYSYEDYPLPIGEGQTISQPYIVAFMTEMIAPGPEDKVLEIGTGSGYQAAILAEIVAEVFTIEINEALYRRTKALLSGMGYKNIHTICGDGFAGYPEAAPFDKIIVTAASSEVPPKLFEQLREGGKMIIPVGEGYQELLLITKLNGQMIRENVLPVRFVPLIDKNGKRY
mgnify:CR=1 FL=1